MAVTTNYSWSTPDNTSYVKDGASSIRTLGSSVDTTLFSVSGGKNVGHQHLNTTTFTAVSSIAIDNIFTSAYSNYEILINLTGTSTANHTLNMRASGSTNSTSNYTYGSYVVIYGSNTVTGAQAVNITTWSEGSRANAGDASATQWQVYNPQLAQKTFVQANTTDGSITRNVGMLFNATTQFDGFILQPTGGTITGTIRVYGLRNS